MKTENEDPKTTDEAEESARLRMWKRIEFLVERDFTVKTVCHREKIDVIPSWKKNMEDYFYWVQVLSDYLDQEWRDTEYALECRKADVATRPKTVAERGL